MSAFVAPSFNPTVRSGTRRAACDPRRLTPAMGPWKEGEKDEAFRQQQEILARRRDKKQNKEYFNNVLKRRDEVEEYFDNRTLKVEHGTDPLIAWQKMKDAGYIDEAGYTEEEESGIPIPMASFGIPKYDRGGRFDLKLPHVEIGYSDPDADVMAKAGRAFKNMFGFGKKDQPEAETSDEQKKEE